MAEAAEGTEEFGAPETPDLGVEGELTEGFGEGQAAGAEGEEPELYTVKVGGKEAKVTLDEALAGYQRNEDYTRKTQELAAQRSQLEAYAQLEAAFQRDPRGTLAALAGVYGVDFGAGQQHGAPAEELDPVESLRQEFRALSQQLQSDRNAQMTAQQSAAQRAQMEQQVLTEVATLKAEVGEFDQDALFQYAVDNSINNLSAAYRAWQYDALEQQRIAEHNKATEAKRRQNVVSGGHNAPAGAVAPGTAGSKPSIREAWALAKAQSQS